MVKMNWKNKRVLVTGSEGMIGKELVILLKELFPVNGNCELHQLDVKFGTDLRNYETCLEACKDKDYVFHLAGVKGSPKMTKERPVDFMGPMLQFDTNMILAAQKYGVKKFLYTSSIAVENPESDKYPAWAKQTAETLIEAMRIQYPVKYAMGAHLNDTDEEIAERERSGDWIGTKYVIVRPANVYGRFDNFERKDNMVITSLIKKAIDDKKLVMDKKGSEQIRDFINSKDVAKGMIQAMEQMPDKPVNLCSGEGWTIKLIAEIISKHLNIPIEYKDLNLTLGPSKKNNEI